MNAPRAPMASTRGPGALVLLVAPVVGALVLGVWAGLVRLGWELPSPGDGVVQAHGTLFACGFFGALIGIERAVALLGGAAPGARWRYAWAPLAPLATSVGALGLGFGLAPALGGGLCVAGAALFVMVSLAVLARQATAFNAVMVLGAGCALAGDLTLVVGSRLVSDAAPWWIGFLALTIAGERLELMRVRRPPASALVMLGALTVALCASLGLRLWDREVGSRAFGAVLVLLSVWMLSFDIARRTIRQPGLTRFSAVALLAGHAWLGVAGAVALAAGALYVGPTYDAMLHAAFVGFAFSMIFGHAPIVLPALTGMRLRFMSLSYAPLALLHASLVLRLAGDLGAGASARVYGGLGTALAIGAFVVTTLTARERTRRRNARAPHRAS